MEAKPRAAGEGAEEVVATTPSLWERTKGAMSGAVQAVGSGLQRAADAVKYSVVSRETEAQIREVNMLLDQLFPTGRSLAHYTGLLLLASLPSQRPRYLRAERPLRDVRFVDRLRFFMRCASVAYGWKLHFAVAAPDVGGMAQGLVRNNATNMKVLLQHLADDGVERTDVKVACWGAHKQTPGHLVLTVHQERSIVVVVRGTFNASDALTDLVASYDDFLDGAGLAHRGMMQAAHRLHAVLADDIARLMREYPGYTLNFVGHSLGGGVAALMAMIYNRLMPVPVHAFCFAPPCVVSPNLSQECRSYVVSVPMGEDIVSRLSYGAMFDLKELVENIVEETSRIEAASAAATDGGGSADAAAGAPSPAATAPPTTGAAVSGTRVKAPPSHPNLVRFFQAAAAGNSLGRGATDNLEWMLGANLRVDISKCRPAHPADRLWLAGDVFPVFWQDGVGFCMEHSSPALFVDVLLTPRSFSDHMPNVLEEALTVVHARLVDEQSKRLAAAAFEDV